MGKYKSIWTGPQIDEGVGAARNPDTVPTSGSDALITSDAVEKVQQGFAPIESDATASQAYAIGDLLVWGGSLYKAKTAIAVNDSFTVGTNIEATTIADKLNNIDTEITPDTDTTINGLLKGNGSKVAQAVGDTDYATPAAVTATRQMLAPILADPAGQAVSSGDFFIYNGVLRKALQAITSAMTAATFTGATYSEAVSNGGLNELKSAFMPKLLSSVTATSGFEIAWNGSCTVGKIVIVTIRIKATASKATGINTLATGFPTCILGSITGSWYCMCSTNDISATCTISDHGVLICNRGAWNVGDVLIISGAYVMQ